MMKSWKLTIFLFSFWTDFSSFLFTLIFESTLKNLKKRLYYDLFNLDFWEKLKTGNFYPTYFPFLDTFLPFICFFLKLLQKCVVAEVRGLGWGGGSWAAFRQFERKQGGLRGSSSTLRRSDVYNTKIPPGLVILPSHYLPISSPFSLSDWTPDLGPNQFVPPKLFPDSVELKTCFGLKNSSVFYLCQSILPSASPSFFHFHLHLWLELLKCCRI